MDQIFEKINALQPEIIVCIAGEIPFSQIEIWEPYFLNCPYKVCVVAGSLGTKEITTWLPVFFIDQGLNHEWLNQLPQLKALLYTTNRPNNFSFFNNAPSIPHVFIGHGESDKHSSASRVSFIYDYIFVADEAAKKRYWTNEIAIPENRFLAIGAPTMPELDVVSGPKQLKNLLYAPTFEGKRDVGNYSSLFDLKDILPAAKSLEPLSLVMRPHPGTGIRLPDFKKAKATLSKIFPQRNLLTKAQQFNWADAIISDISGVLSEFLFTCKPIIIPVAPDNERVNLALSRSTLKNVVYSWDYTTQSLSDFMRSIESDPLFEQRKKVRDEKFLNCQNFQDSQTLFNTALERILPSATSTPAMTFPNKQLPQVTYSGKKPVKAIVLEQGKRTSPISCPVCHGSMLIQRIDYVLSENADARIGENIFNCCLHCGLIFNPDNIDKTFNPADAPGKRAGDEVQPGREFRLAEKAKDVFGNGNRNISMLVFGAGLSKDWMHISKLDKVTVSITDLQNYQEADCWVPLDSPSVYDIVIASEVIEHFESPLNNMATLLRFANTEGVVICGTNLTTPAEPLHKRNYPFTKGHCTYWSSAGLAHVAETFGHYMNITYSSKGGPRKRFIFFTKCLATHNKISVFNGKEHYFI